MKCALHWGFVVMLAMSVRCSGIEEGKGPAAEKAEAFQIKAQPGATLERDFRAKYLAWWERNLLGPAKAQLKGTAWEAEAGKFLDAAVAHYVRDEAGDRPDELMQAGLALNEKGCPDPLVLYFTGHFTDEVLGNFFGKYTTQQVYKRLQTTWEGDPARGGVVGLLFLWENANLYQFPGMREKMDEEAAWLMASLLADGKTYLPGEEDIWMHQLFAGLDGGHFSRAFERYAPLLEIKPGEPGVLPDWERDTLQGVIEKNRAWAARGSDWAANVSPGGWEGFAKHLKIAHDALAQAWKEHPTAPYAPTAMIGVTMGGAVESGESEKVWFDRAIAAEFDYAPAYEAVLWAMRPRWGGSYDLMRAFGEACMDSGRYDTEVPRMFVSACNDIAEDFGDTWPDYFRHQAGLAARMEKHLQNLAAEPSRKPLAWMDQSYAAVNQWIVGDYAAAQATLTALGERGLAPRPREKLRNFGGDEGTLREEAALLGSKDADKYRAAESLLKDGKAQFASILYAQLLATGSVEGRPYIQAKQDRIKLAGDLADGNWHPLPARPGLLDWKMAAGQWSADADGTITAKGCNGFALLLFPLSLGANYDLRAEISGEAPGQERSPKSSPAGLAFGYESAGGGRWLNAHFTGWPKENYSFSVCSEWRWETVHKGEKVAWQEWTPLELHVRAGIVTCLVNGKTTLLDSAPMPMAQSGAQIGLTAYQTTLGSVVRFRGIALRQQP